MPTRTFTAATVLLRTEGPTAPEAHKCREPGPLPSRVDSPSTLPPRARPLGDTGAGRTAHTEGLGSQRPALRASSGFHSGSAARRAPGHRRGDSMTSADTAALQRGRLTGPRPRASGSAAWWRFPRAFTSNAAFPPQWTPLLPLWGARWEPLPVVRREPSPRQTAPPARAETEVNGPAPTGGKAWGEGLLTQRPARHGHPGALRDNHEMGPVSSPRRRPGEVTPRSGDTRQNRQGQREMPATAPGAPGLCGASCLHGPSRGLPRRA